ncbi:hypothetical protein SeMB42_g00447 [Synchytrium endobioticum]|uniref:PH domain-containing protein n=1 Tax=Synchytrium endobioticum TaxID=286115 RepID=A0A507DI87_9FUNG|nr:hypothetical protein SeLEV6574_g00311 [Synchytrium endobioticum]TPX54053.1 hypothetical protein SeMB42_g00447 [Synchytrium endobioticum]
MSETAGATSSSLFTVVQTGDSEALASLLAKHPELHLVQTDHSFELDADIAKLLGDDTSKMTGLQAALALYSTSRTACDQQTSLAIVNIFLKTLPSGDILNQLRFGCDNTALHLAASLGLKGAVISLMGQGALANVTNSLGKTVLDVAEHDVAELIRWSMKSQERKKQRGDTIPRAKPALSVSTSKSVSNAVAPAAEPKSVRDAKLASATVKPDDLVPSHTTTQEQRIAAMSVQGLTRLPSPTSPARFNATSPIKSTSSTTSLPPLAASPSRNEKSDGTVAPSDDEIRNSYRQAVTTSSDLEFLRQAGRVKGFKQALGDSTTSDTTETAIYASVKISKNSSFVPTGTLNSISRGGGVSSSKSSHARPSIPTNWSQSPTGTSSADTAATSITTPPSVPVEPEKVEEKLQQRADDEIVKATESKRKSVKDLLSEFSGDKMFEKAVNRTPAVRVLPPKSIEATTVDASIGVVEASSMELQPAEKAEALQVMEKPKIEAPVETEKSPADEPVNTTQGVAGEEITLKVNAGPVLKKGLSRSHGQESEEPLAPALVPLLPSELQLEVPIDFDLNLGLDWLAASSTAIDEPIMEPRGGETVVYDTGVHVEHSNAPAVIHETKDTLRFDLVDAAPAIVVSKQIAVSESAMEAPRITPQQLHNDATPAQPLRPTIVIRKPSQQSPLSLQTPQPAALSSCPPDIENSLSRSSTLIDGPPQIDAWLAELEAADALSKFNYSQSPSAESFARESLPPLSPTRSIGSARTTVNSSSRFVDVTAAPRGAKSESRVMPGNFFIQLYDVEDVGFPNPGGVLVNFTIAHASNVESTTNTMHIKEGTHSIKFHHECILKVTRDQPFTLIANFKPAQPIVVSHHQPPKSRKGFFSFGRKSGQQAANAMAPPMGNPSWNGSASSVASATSIRPGQSCGFLPNEGVQGHFGCDPFAWATEADISTCGEVWDGVLDVRVNDVIVARVGTKVAFVRDVYKHSHGPTSIGEIEMALKSQAWWKREIRSGFLTHLTGDVRAMRKRYFILRGAILYAYAEMDGNLTLRNTIDLRNMVSVSAERSTATGGGRGEFRINFAGGAFEQFKSDPASDCDAWVTAIQSLGPEQTWPVWPEVLIGPRPQTL